MVTGEQSFLNVPVSASRIVVKARSQPALDLAEVHAFALTVVFHLVTADFAHAEVAGLRMREVEAADR